MGKVKKAESKIKIASRSLQANLTTKKSYQNSGKFKCKLSLNEKIDDIGLKKFETTTPTNRKIASKGP